MIVGLTGGIGSGKSTIGKLFKDLGVPVYNSDIEAKSLMNTSQNIKEAIINLLGENAYQGAMINRDYIANKVFKDEKLLEALNKIVHPVVKKHFKDWKDNQDAAYVIQETALIFENNSQDNYDKIILIVAPIEIRLSRVMARDSVSKSSIKARMDNQLEDTEKIDMADYIVENIDLEKTFESIKNIHDELVSESRKT